MLSLSAFRTAGLSGQALTESIIMMPLFFLFAFGLLQVAQLGVAAIVVNYAASTVARKAASERDYSTAPKGNGVDVSGYLTKASGLMTAGMQFDSMLGCIGNDLDPGAPTGELEVAVRARVAAWPLFGNALHAALGSDYGDAGVACPDLSNKGFGPFNFTNDAPYYFYVTGKSKARLNYRQ